MTGLTWSNLAWAGGGPGPVPYDPTLVPFNLSETGFIATNQTTLRIRERGGYVFAAGANMLTVVDYQDASNPAQVYQRGYTESHLNNNTLSASDLLIGGNIL